LATILSTAACTLSPTGVATRSPTVGALCECLYWEDNGFVLYYKALAKEKFRWPRRGEEVVSLTGQQINWLLEGYDISLMNGHRKLHYESVF